MLDKRLNAILNYVDKGKIVADVGCDHCLLSVELIKQNIASKVYAIENKIGPLNNAIKTINKFNLSDKIFPILSDGLKEIDMTNGVIVIAGMGGELIKNILENKHSSNEILILEPNNNSRIVREYLSLNYYKIIDEDIIIEKGIYYFLLKAIPSSERMQLSSIELEYGPINLIKKSPNLLSFLIKNKNVLNEALISSKQNNEISLKLKRIEEAINEISKN